ncbi:MAG: hypothetical protein Q9219_000498 [cf. Caloplaca sp. 3 TL-2023]
MQRHQYHTHSAPSLNTSLAERPRPPVPHFSNSTGNLPQQSLDMASFNNMQGSYSGTSSFSSSSLTSSESDPDPIWGGIDFQHGPGLEMNAASLGGNYLDGFPCSTSNFTPLEHTSSTDSQTISPSEMHISAPASGALTFDSTPQTDFFDSPAIYSNDPSPAWTFRESPAINDNWEYDQNIGHLQMFPDLPGEPKKQVTLGGAVTKKSLSMSRKASSPSKASPSSRPSGITKKKKKSKGPLPDIIVDVNDPAAVKRARNTQAARKSRGRKADKYVHTAIQCRRWKQRALEAGWSGDVEDDYSVDEFDSESE